MMNTKILKKVIEEKYNFKHNKKNKKFLIELVTLIFMLKYKNELSAISEVEVSDTIAKLDLNKFFKIILQYQNTNDNKEYKGYLSVILADDKLIEIVDLYLKLYTMHINLPKSSYFYEENFSSEKNEEFIKNFSLIIKEIGYINECIENYVGVGFSVVIKNVKKSLLEAKNEV
ncbi:MAG: hypothetical protein ACRC42_02795 [Mycoplasma sp.]